MTGEQRLRRHHHRQRRRRRHAGRAPGAVRQADPASSSAATGCPARSRTGTPTRSSSRTATSSKDTWYDDQGKGFQPGIHYYVGGQTKFYGAALYRLREEDFGELRHHDGISPAWPISYDEFEPYYTKAEQLYEVHGNHAEDPTEPRASGAYPFPAVTHEPRIQQLSDDLERAGYHPFHAPCGIRLLEGDMPNSVCIRCATCDGFPSLVMGKSDAEIFGVRPALKHPNVTLLTNARATRLTTDDAGTTVTGVEVDQARPEDDVSAATSSSSPPAPRTPRRSCSPRPTTATRTASPTAPTRSAATTCSTTARPSWRSPRNRTRRSSRRRSGVNDFYFGMPGFEYPMGNIQMVGKSSAPMFRGEKPLQTKLAPTFTPRRGRQARRRLLAVDRGPAAPRQPGDAGHGRQHHADLHLQQPGAEEAAVQQAQVDARPPRACIPTT